ncbi:MAG: hypothetical protein Q9160_005316 [Pyrenula sp. 1 TL-2023]
MSSLIPILLLSSWTWCSASPLELRDPGGLEYTVIGDSWAAGSGAGGLATRWPKDAPSNCDQDPGSYASLLQNDTDTGISKLNFQACAGQTPDQVLNCQVGDDNHPPSDNGCKTAKPTSLGKPGLMTIHLGADALDLENLIKICFYQDDRAGCDQAFSKSQAALDSLDKSKMILNTIKAAIQKTGIEPAKVLVLNYVAFFNVDTPDTLRCIINSEVPANQSRRRQTNDLIMRLNGLIARDAEAAGAKLIAVERPGGPFDKHRWCDSGNDHWFTGLVTKDDIDQFDQGNLYIGRLWRPTGAGYFAYHNAIREAIGLKPLPMPDRLVPYQPFAAPIFPFGPHGAKRSLSTERGSY